MYSSSSLFSFPDFLVSSQIATGVFWRGAFLHSLSSTCFCSKPVIAFPKVLFCQRQSTSAFQGTVQMNEDLHNKAWDGTGRRKMLLSKSQGGSSNF